MKNAIVIFFLFPILFSFCSRTSSPQELTGENITDSIPPVEEREEVIPISVEIKKELTYDQHTLEDEYPYKDTVRVFQWEKIKEKLIFLDSIQQKPADWAILQNYKNKNGESPTIRNYVRNAYNRVSDSTGVERYQSVALYLENDSTEAERYGRDGSLVKILDERGNFYLIENTNFKGKWLVAKKYVKQIGDTVNFHKAVFVDRTNQNIATLEKGEGSTWLVRSMNPATTGVHRPPYAHETPLGMFVVQEKKAKMLYTRDGSSELAGYAPYASRFTNGAYLHGVPLNSVNAAMVEFSPTLGTTPRSHMCVRNATSHAKFMYDWATVENSVVFVIE